MSNITLAKEMLRGKMRTTRRALPKVFRTGADAKILQEFSNRLKTFPAETIIAGYLGQGSELDAGPLLFAANAKGFRTALPVVRSENAPLSFYEWGPNDGLTHGAFGTRIPARQETEVFPDIVLVPLLAYDRRGHRLGQGGGYYDRTLPTLKKKKKVVVIGLGFSAQGVDAVPFAPHDLVLDEILTEKGFQTFLKLGI